MTTYASNSSTHTRTNDGSILFNTFIPIPTFASHFPGHIMEAVLKTKQVFILMHGPKKGSVPVGLTMFNIEDVDNMIKFLRHNISEMTKAGKPQDLVIQKKGFKEVVLHFEQTVGILSCLIRVSDFITELLTKLPEGEEEKVMKKKTDLSQEDQDLIDSHMEELAKRMEAAKVSSTAEECNNDDDEKTHMKTVLSEEVMPQNKWGDDEEPPALVDDSDDDDELSIADVIANDSDDDYQDLIDSDADEDVPNLM